MKNLPKIIQAIRQVRACKKHARCGDPPRPCGGHFALGNVIGWGGYGGADPCRACASLVAAEIARHRRRRGK